MDRVGDAREITVSGEPVFDARRKFTGYRGVMQDTAVHRRVKLSPKSGYTGANQLLAALHSEHYQRLLTGGPCDPIVTNRW